MTGGKIAEIYVEKGEYVEPGRRLAQLDTTQLELTASISANGGEMVENSIVNLTEALQAANEAPETTRHNLERYESLYENDAISLSNLENMRLQLTSQQAICTKLENDLANVRISPPALSLISSRCSKVFRIMF